MIEDSTYYRPFDIPPDLNSLESENIKLSQENKVLKVMLISLAKVETYLLFRHLISKRKELNKPQTEENM